jgi:glutathione S-transferase
MAVPFSTAAPRVAVGSDGRNSDLYVCHGDDGGPRIHPCRRVQEALRAAGIEYRKVIAAHGHPIPFLRKGSREELREATGETKLPALKLPDGTVITHSRAILGWISRPS